MVTVHGILCAGARFTEYGGGLVRGAICDLVVAAIPSDMALGER